MVTQNPGAGHVAFYSGVERVSDVLGRMEKPADEAAIVTELLQFANADAIELSRLTHAFVDAASRYDAALSKASGTYQTILADYTRSIAPLAQAWVREELQKIVCGRGEFERFDRATPGAQSRYFGGPLVSEIMSPSLRVERRYAFANLQDFVQWGVLLTRAQHANDLCLCGLDSCRRFFLAQTTGGRTMRNYCSAEHRDARHRKSGAERVAASREGISVSDWRRKQRRRRK